MHPSNDQATDPADPTAPTAATPAPRSDPPVGGAAGHGLYDLPLTPVTVPGQERRRLPVVGIALAIVVVLGGAGLFMAGYTFGERQAETPGTPAGQEQAFQPFWDAYHAVVERYAGGEVDQQKLVEGAIRGMIEALGDPYSSYLTSEEYRESLQGISGQFEGIGVQIATQDEAGKRVECTSLGASCQLVVVEPLDGSPALKAGMRPGDVIVGVDGSSVAGLSVDEVQRRIRGDKGTEVRLSVVRDGGEPFELAIVRDVIVQEEVVHRVLDAGGVGYTKLTGFSDHAADVLVEEVRKDVEAGRKKLILDLRGNPGGFVTAAKTVASQYLREGPIFWEESADGTQEPTNATGDGAAIDPSIKLVVLIDRGSASASEIVAGALQDTGRATLVGETTFGKGTVQTWEELAGGNGAMRLTIAKWLTPEKRWIHGEGITPDVAVPVPDGTAAGEDPVLDRAIAILDRPSAGRSVLPVAA